MTGFGRRNAISSRRCAVTVRSSNSPVIVWPNRDAVTQSLADWATTSAERHPELLRLGYYGSYARYDWGAGSDLDLVAIVPHAPTPFENRSLGWDLSPLPVPTDLLIYTIEEWRAVQQRGGRFAETLSRETIWILE